MLSAKELAAKLNDTFRAQIPEALAIAFLPPAIPGLGTSGGFSLWVQDHSGGSVEYLNQNLQKFLEAARKRPELQGVNSSFRAAVPQVFVDVDRDKALKQGVPIADVYQTLQAFLGGSFVNQFNRFGRQWRVYLQGEGGERGSADDVVFGATVSGRGIPLAGIESMIGLFIPAWVVYQIFDAYHTARARREGLPLPDPFGLNELGNRLGVQSPTPAPGAPGAAGNPAAYSAAPP